MAHYTLHPQLEKALRGWRRDGCAGQLRFSLDLNHSSENFTLPEKESYLILLISRHSDPEQISADFFKRFNESIELDDLLAFIQLLKGKSWLSASSSSPPTKLQRDTTPESSEPLTALPPGGRQTLGLYNFILRTASLLSPFVPLFRRRWRLSLVIVIILFIFSVSIAFRQFNEFIFASGSLKYSFSTAILYVMNLLIVNLLAKSIQVATVKYFGCLPLVYDLGLVLELGFAPRFWFNKKFILLHLNHAERLAAYLSPILLKISLFSTLLLFWSFNYGQFSLIDNFLAQFAFTVLISLLINIYPFFPFDGYYSFVTFFNLPVNLIPSGYKAISFILLNRRLPRHFSLQKYHIFMIVGLVSSISIAGLSVILLYKFTSELQGLLPNIFGLASTGVIFLFLFSRFIHWFFNRHGSSPSPIPSLKPISDHRLFFTLEGMHNYLFTKSPLNSIYKRVYLSTKTFRSSALWRPRIIILAIALLFPYRINPGGQVSIETPSKQNIVTPINGTIASVYQAGGSEQIVRKGNPIATIQSDELNLSSSEARNSKKSLEKTLEINKRELNDLLNNPSKDEVEVQNSAIRMAESQVSAAQIDAATQLSNLQYAKRDLARIKPVYEAGAYPVSDYDLAVTKVENARSEHQKALQDIITAKASLNREKDRLNDLMTKTDPEQIEAARQAVLKVQAELLSADESVKYFQDQLESARILMPFDGFIVTPRLNDFVGTFFQKGSVFAVAEVSLHTQAYLSLPEWNIGEVKLGDPVTIRLSAYPGTDFTGTIKSLQPNVDKADSASLQPSTNQLPILIEIDSSSERFKGGMTGYAKVSGPVVPLAYAFLRPVIRFVYVELWSWLP